MKLRGKSVFKYQIYFPTTVLMLLRPRLQEGQSVVREEFNIVPFTPSVEYNDGFGNYCIRAVLPVGDVTITSEVEVQVKVTATPFYPLPTFVPVEELPIDTLVYLLPSRYCQSDFFELQNLALAVVGNALWGYEQVEAIRSWIHWNIKYEYNTTNSSTTALDVSRQRIGVCRDFTHLGIALCRCLCIPARMVTGYISKLNFMDIHAWFEAFIGGQWHTFDAVQAQTEGYRIVLGYGRDAADVAMVTQYGNAFLQSLDVETQLIES